MGNNSSKYSNELLILNFGNKKQKKGREYIYKNYKFIKIVKLRNEKKKYSAIFKNLKTDRNKVVKFGSAGMSDYTKHKDNERKERYIKRHKKRENWNNLISPGALSRWILWNKKTIKSSLADYKKKFKKRG